MHYFTANTFFKETCEYACSIALLSHRMNCLNSYITIYYALYSCEKINRKVNCALIPTMLSSLMKFSYSWTGFRYPRIGFCFHKIKSSTRIFLKARDASPEQIYMMVCELLCDGYPEHIYMMVCGLLCDGL